MPPFGVSLVGLAALSLGMVSVEIVSTFVALGL